MDVKWFLRKLFRVCWVFIPKVKSVQLVSERRWTPSGQKEIQVWENFISLKWFWDFLLGLVWIANLTWEPSYQLSSCGPSAVCSPHCNSLPMNQICQVSEGWAVLCFCVRIRENSQALRASPGCTAVLRMGTELQSSLSPSAVCPWSGAAWDSLSWFLGPESFQKSQGPAFPLLLENDTFHP